MLEGPPKTPVLAHFASMYSEEIISIRLIYKSDEYSADLADPLDVKSVSPFGNGANVAGALQVVELRGWNGECMAGILPVIFISPERLAQLGWEEVDGPPGPWSSTA
jgi:hypothetical protein